MLDKLKKELENIAKGLTSFYSSETKSIPASKIKDQSSVNKAIDCAVEMIHSNTYRGEKIGMIRTDIPDFILIGSLRRGEAVLYKEENDGTVTVYQPYNKEFIKKQKARGPLNFSSTTINIPKKREKN